MVNYLKDERKTMNEIWVNEENLLEKKDRVGITGLSDKELVKLVLRSKDTLFADTLAEDTLSVIDEAPVNMVSRLISIGVDESTAISVTATLELARRRTTKKFKSLTTPNDIYQIIRHYALDSYQERLIVIAFNGAQEVIFCKVVTQGLINKTVVHPREVFSEAIEKRACAIAIAHNHPSGCLSPSNEDKEITKRLNSASNILGIKLLDHLIISEDGYLSFREEGLM